MESSGNGVVGLETLELAQNVIRSIRCKSFVKQRYFGNNECYQSKFEACESYLSAKELNHIIEAETKESHKKLQTLLEMNAAIEQFKGTSLPTKQEIFDRTMNKGNNQAGGDDSSDDFDSDNDDESNGRKARRLRSAIKNSRRLTEDTFGSSCDYDSIDRNRHVAQIGPMDTDMDMDDDDDEEGMRELFKDFVAPSSIKHEKKHSSHYTTGVKNTPNLDSINVRKGVTIKPGQAIRVKPGNKGKKSANENC